MNRGAYFARRAQIIASLSFFALLQSRMGVKRWLATFRRLVGILY